ncbi:hypothetical protein CWI69_07040 [Pseudidiomarina halophila]|uniref:DUF805 domain-containing protein n=2 Tax=Pseudidiomarina halophila TaxID=1449799 RepID=A0A432XVP3_9GAMM|nr:hypothetical protein CWI69_07040 [Pseudidiomarina halophila]
MMGHEMFTGTGFLWMLLIGVILVAPTWRLCQRIGYPGPLGLLILVPFANIGLLYFIAFAPWKTKSKSSGT